jgi:hypothetical protein
MGSGGHTNYSAVLIHSSFVDEAAKLAISEVDDEILICSLLCQYTYATSEMRLRS